MLAVHLTGHGQPLKLVNIPIPTVGPNQVLVKVAAAGINNTDIWTREGKYSADGTSGWRGDLKFPRVQGGDICGYIEKVGDEVPASRIGERVLVDSTIYGPNHHLDSKLLGSEYDGGFAEYCLVPADNAYNMEGCPLSDIELAAIPIAYITAEHMRVLANVQKGDTVLITGASGGVGTAAIDLVHDIGADVIAVTSGSKGSKLGCKWSLDRAKPLKGQLEEIGLWNKVDSVLDLVGGDNVQVVLESLRPGGRYVVGGAMGGFYANIDLRTLYLKQIALFGSSMAPREEVEVLFKKVREGRFRPKIGHTFDLEQIVQAQDQFEQRNHVGKMVLKVAK